jgi:hypothetical protein
VVEGARLESVYTVKGIKGSNPFLSANNFYFNLMNNIIFIIPTINSENYITQLKNYLEKYGAKYFFFVDKKSSDNTYSILNKITDNVDYFDNNKSFLENSLEQLYSKFKDYYIFRLDDDEIPSPNLIFNLKKYTNIKKKIFGIRRYEALIYNNKEYISGPLSYYRSLVYRINRQIGNNNKKKLFLENFSERRGIQYRFYLNKNLKFAKTLHSPGIEFSKKEVYKIPYSDGYLIHLNLLFKSIQERIKKIQRYNDVYKRGGSFNQFLYTPELYIKDNQEILKYFLNRFPIFLNDYLKNIRL